MQAAVARPGSAIRSVFRIARWHIVAIAATGLFTFGWIFTGHYPWALAAICGLDWFLVNLLNRVVDLPEDRANRIAGTDFVARHRRAIAAGGLGTLFGSLVAVHLLYPAITPLRLAYHALGLAYNWPLLPGGRRIKALYFWKNTASAVGFMLTVFGYPLLAYPERAADVTPLTIGLAAAFFFAFELSYEVIYDLRDAVGDGRAGVRTYPVVHGVRGAVRIIDGLLAVSVAVILGGFAAGAVPWRLAVMFAAPLIQLAVYKRALRRGISATDCTTLTWLGAGLLVAYHVWVVLGLPGVG